MSKPTVIIAAVVLCTAIILGAMAAHGLAKIVSPATMETFETGVRYQFYAGFSLLILGLASNKFSFSLKWFNILTIAGLKLFSGCIYLYSLHEQIPSLKPLVMLVPVGGSCLIAAWIVFLFQLIRSKKQG